MKAEDQRRREERNSRTDFDYFFVYAVCFVFSIGKPKKPKEKKKE